MTVTVSRNLASRRDVVVTEAKPQGLKPGNICSGYGTAEAVPLTDRAACGGEQSTANADADSFRE
jgi:hypothetical protein